uniref:Uncharacterized protein n=1 Tax=viral metagenome TaxID=1070528 RepID=A0A6C0D6K3_9ZZZZ
MSNIFQNVLTDVTNVQQNLLGPDYPYWKNIKTPSQIGMSDQGNLSAMAKDVNGLVQYVEVLVTGGGASSTGGPLGNKFFLQTGGKCKDVKSGNQVDRFIYINNVPSGNIPFVSAGLDTNFSEFKGLIPGAMSNLNSLNPFAIMSSFAAGSLPECQEITLDVVGPTPPSAGNPLGPNATGRQTHFVTTVDIKNMDACNWGRGGTNPVSGKRCNETFTNMNPNPVSTKSESLPEDPIVQFYFACLGLLGVYIIYRMTTNAK